MKIRFTITSFVILLCIFYTSLSAIANVPAKEKELSLLDKDAIEEGCMRTCLEDYTKVAKCDINEMIGEYISELNKEN